MHSTTPRDLTWNEIRARLDGTRHLIWQWLLHHGPATTSEIAAALDISLLTVRPRVSELVAIGFAECTGRQIREGIYAALTISQAQLAHERAHTASQLSLLLS